MERRATDEADRPVLVWLRHALRLSDNPVLEAALARATGGPVIPVHVDDGATGAWAAGPASRWWRERSLVSLDAHLRERGSRLLRISGPEEAALLALCAETGAVHVVADRRWEPARAEADEAVSRALSAVGVEMHSVDADLLFDPTRVETRDGRPFTTFTPYWRACLRLPAPPPPTGAPAAIPAPRVWPTGVLARTAPSPAPEAGGPSSLDSAWEPRAECWQPGERGAGEALTLFLDQGLAEYDQGRDRPDLDGTSRLSPHLHFGEISPREVWHRVNERARALADGGGRRPRTRGAGQGGGEGAAASEAAVEVFLKEVVWREFAHHLLHHFPHTPEQPLRSRYAAFPWEDDPEGLEAWQRGQTGFPIVDAGMRQLAATGWMHNRVRMVVASFLVKDLLLPWQEGAAWFWRGLVDADLANNTLGWQWAAGSGADAAPYFRVFNPTLQGERHDPRGDYVRRWVPELGSMPERWIHRPGEAPDPVLREAGVRLGEDYPVPILDHARAREAALAAFRSLRSIEE